MNRKKYRKKLVLKPSIKKNINRLLITILIVLATLIAMKKKPELKKYISENIYQKVFLSFIHQRADWLFRRQEQMSAIGFCRIFFYK